MNYFYSQHLSRIQPNADCMMDAFPKMGQQVYTGTYCCCLNIAPIDDHCINCTAGL